MQKTIFITAGEVVAHAHLYANETADAIWKALPLEGIAHRWGEEIYFDIPVIIPESEEARQDMQVGELGYWPTGNAFCVFFGPTPVSEGQTPRAYSNVNPFGLVEGDPRAFTAVKEGTQVIVEQEPNN